MRSTQTSATHWLPLRRHVFRWTGSVSLCRNSHVWSTGVVQSMEQISDGLATNIFADTILIQRTSCSAALLDHGWPLRSAPARAIFLTMASSVKVVCALRNPWQPHKALGVSPPVHRSR